MRRPAPESRAVTMPELTTRDGMPPPADLPDGECIVTRLDDGSIRIDQADPRILISGELLDGIRAGTPWALLEERPLQASLETPVTYVGATLKINAVNRQVVYCVVDYVPRVHGYIAEWPD